MRTLFLLTVLATLLVFVIKKPDQTFWEAAHGLWGQIEGIASEVAEAPPVPLLTGNAGEDFGPCGSGFAGHWKSMTGSAIPSMGSLWRPGVRAGRIGTVPPTPTSPLLKSRP